MFEKFTKKADDRVTFGTLRKLSNYVEGQDDIESINTEVLISDLKEFQEIEHATSIQKFVEKTKT